jgi:hypothetical protein
MDKILRNARGQSGVWRILLFVLVSICCCSRSVAAWGLLNNPQDRADINSLLPQLATPGQGLWGAPRTNPSRMRPGQILQDHYNEEHGVLAKHTRVLPRFNGVLVAAVDSPHPATAEEVVMARFIASLAPPGGGNPVVPGNAEIRTKSGGSREVRILVPRGQVQVADRYGAGGPARYCLIMLPAPAATPPTNVCTLFFGA